MRTGGDVMQEKSEMLPEIIVFAGPNGSGKTTVTSQKIEDLVDITKE